MIPTELIQRQKVILYMIETCCIKQDELTDWENEFIDSINESFAKKNNLTNRQCEILEKIYDKL